MLDNLKGKKIILASKSPRRQQLLRGLGIEFEIRTKDTDETYPELLKEQEVALFLADKKASEFDSEIKNNEIIITSDTIVCIEGVVLNKPNDFDEALSMLSFLNGKMHVVHTGVCILSKEKKELFCSSTNVYFKTLSREELTYYIHTCRPYDKAGSYGVQEWMGYAGIEKIEGCFFNVMGIPLSLVYEKLKLF